MLSCLLLAVLPAVDQPGGANSPPPSPPPASPVAVAEVDAGGFRVRVPDGTWTAPEGGAAAYSVPGPLIAFRGADGAWRGHSYIESLSPVAAVRVRGLRAEPPATDARAIRYEFIDGTAYTATVISGGGAVDVREEADLGPRNAWVFDAYYGWQPTAGAAFDAAAVHHRSLFLPCYYDKPEVTVIPAALAAGAPGQPGGVAVVGPQRDVIGCWAVAPAAWKGAESWSFQLWQRRQKPGDPASRHFLGPDTKSDGTPNPRTAPLLGPSLYEGHVTIEFAIGTGTRSLGFAAVAAGDGPDLLAPLLRIAAAKR